MGNSSSRKSKRSGKVTPGPDTVTTTNAGTAGGEQVTVTAEMAIRNNEKASATGEPATYPLGPPQQPINQMGAPQLPVNQMGVPQQPIYPPHQPINQIGAPQQPMYPPQQPINQAGAPQQPINSIGPQPVIMTVPIQVDNKSNKKLAKKAKKAGKKAKGAGSSTIEVIQVAYDSSSESSDDSLEEDLEKACTLAACCVVACCIGKFLCECIQCLLSCM